MRFPDNEALVVRHQNVRWRYGTLTEKVDAFAAGLLALGLEPGDRIGIWSPNNSEWAVTQFAAAQAGLILVNINPAYRLTELEYAPQQGRVPGRWSPPNRSSRAAISRCCASSRRSSTAPGPAG